MYNILLWTSIWLFSTTTDKLACAEKSGGIHENFFVVTAIFNPASFKSRYTLYHDFARHMNETNAQLITIECIYPSLNQHQFQVTDSNNPNHIQLKSKAIYWMKEDLINIAVQRLPAYAKWVAWVDADIQFHDNNWVDLTIKELQKYVTVQLFRTCRFLGPPPQYEVLRDDYSFGYSIRHGKPIDQTKYHLWYPHPGYAAITKSAQIPFLAWAMDIEAFRQMGGLPDFDIVGSGDLHFSFSLVNRVSMAIDKSLHSAFKETLVSKAKKIFSTLQYISNSENKGIIGYVPMTISHHWHGSRKNRQYVNRWSILVGHKFDYKTDVKKNTNGLLEFVDKERSESNCTKTIQEEILALFQLRLEDELKCVFEENVAHQFHKKPVSRIVTHTYDQLLYRQYRNDSSLNGKYLPNLTCQQNTINNLRPRLVNGPTITSSRVGYNRSCCPDMKSSYKKFNDYNDTINIQLQ